MTTVYACDGDKHCKLKGENEKLKTLVTKLEEEKVLLESKLDKLGNGKYKANDENSESEEKDSKQGKVTYDENGNVLGRRVGDFFWVYKPISWSNATKWIKDKTSPDKFGRSIEQLEKYKRERKLYLNYFESSKDKILVYFFQCPCKISVKTNKLEPIIDENKIAKYAMRLNDFPYYFEENIRHYLLFSRIGKMDDKAINKAIDEYMQNNEKNVKYESTYWENPPHIQTIPELWHVHILIKIDSKL